MLSFLGFRRRSTRVDSEPRFAGERKAIRDKKERFFERKGGLEVVVAVVESASGGDQERPAYSERVTGVRVKRRWETRASGSLAHRREERRRHGMLTCVAMPFGAPSIGFLERTPVSFPTFEQKV
jgi:hypothetical protein